MLKPLKLSKTTRWILTIGILAILLASLGIIYARQTTELRELNTSVAQAHQDFIKYTTQRKELEEGLETKLGQTKSSIASLQDEFGQYTESIEINKALFETADEVNVTITELSSSPPKEEKLNGITYQVFTLRLAVEGKVVPLPDFIRFIMKLSDKFPSSDINSVKVTASDEEGSLDLSMKIYTYEAK